MRELRSSINVLKCSAPGREPGRAARGRIERAVRHFGGRLGRRALVRALEDTQPPCDNGEQQLRRVFAHQFGVLRPYRRSDRQDADYHDEQQSGIEDARVGLSADQRTEAVNDIHRQMAATASLSVANNAASLIRPRGDSDR
jgi:hypothetical protein